MASVHPFGLKMWVKFTGNIFYFKLFTNNRTKKEAVKDKQSSVGREMLSFLKAYYAVQQVFLKLLVV